MSRSHRITLSGLDFIPDLSGALYAPEFGALLVADLHLEKGTSLARRGVHLPPYDTRESLLQLKAAIEAARPERLIFLGDSFHDGEARERIDAADLACCAPITAAVATVWITGNHDPAPPAGRGRHHHRGDGAGPGDAPPPARACCAPARRRLQGTCIRRRRSHARGHRIRCRCFIADERRLIMPAFGSYTGALSVRSEAFEGLFGDFHVWMIGDKAVHRFPASQVR